MNKAVAAIALVFAFACSAGAHAGSAEEKAAKALDRFERTGEVRDCLLGSTIDEIDPITDELFLVRVGVNDYYLNEVNGACHGAARSFSRIEYVRSTSQLCRLQIITVVDNTSNIFLGSCSLGGFEKLNVKPKPAETVAPTN